MWMIWIQLPHCSPQGRHLWHINLWKASSRKATILQWRIDEYSILPYSFIIGVHGYVLVYSVTSLHSFQVIESLYQKLHEGHGKTRVPVVLVGNKADLSPEREVQAVEGKKLAESWGATFMESSARENQVLGPKTRRVVVVAVFSLLYCLVGMLQEWSFHPRAGWYWH
ncbi:GTPase RhebL1 isoform X3 [Papio anubis]|uniref:GTPase RhebL1 isoform X5 n=1 Tax=Cercocebus atys TaxID=9531 RepID=UPI0005F52500|nr:PREDICTED: GTPase RhebL1 isoform X5 [Cercocebus atys]XP_021777974.1 GTPase RhebL1 isoform X3 [Papio anubis]